MKYHLLKLIILFFCLAFKLQAQDVYVGGQDYPESNKGVAVYWKNGQPHYVKIRGGAYSESFINSIYVLGKDVHAVGAESHSGWGRGAVYWKNDKEVKDLSTEKAQLSEAKSVSISGNDLLIACNRISTGSTTGYYWRNNEITQLKSPILGVSYSNAITRHDNQTYCAGYTIAPIGKTSTIKIAKYWIDNKDISLTDGKRDAEASSIFVYENNIYISGWEYNKEPKFFDTFQKKIAKYWINSKDRFVNLTDGRYDACVNSIFVYNGVVYVAGWEKNDKGKKVAKYWKNNGESEMILSNGENDAEATSIFVYNGDVYISGTDFMKAKYWVNDIHGEVVLSDNLSSANSIFVVEGDGQPKKIENPILPKESNIEKNELIAARGDEYLAGYDNNNGKTVAKYWKNGVATTLTNGERNAKALSVFATETNDVYVCGWEENSSGVKVAKYWKNRDNAFELSTGLYDAEAVAIFVVNQKVYIAGYITTAQKARKAVYWENGTLNRLSDVSDDASATSIYVHDGVVYIAGFEGNSAKIVVAKYWVDKKVISLSDGTKSTMAICIYRQGNDVIIAGAMEEKSGWVPLNWKNSTPFNVDAREFAFLNSVPVNKQRTDGYVTSVFYANGITNTYSKDVAGIVPSIEMESSIMPKYYEPKIDLDEIRFKKAQEIMRAYIRRKNLGTDFNREHLIGILEDFYDERPIFHLRYRTYDGSIETLRINWHGWGLCRYDEATDECYRIRDFVDADDFKESVCRKGEVVDVRRVRGVEIKIKLIHYLGNIN